MTTTLTGNVNVHLALKSELWNGDIITSLRAPWAHLEMATSGFTSECITWIATAGRGVADRGWVRKHAFVRSNHPASSQNRTKGQVGLGDGIPGFPIPVGPIIRQNSSWATS